MSVPNSKEKTKNSAMILPFWFNHFYRRNIDVGVCQRRWRYLMLDFKVGLTSKSTVNITTLKIKNLEQWMWLLT